MKFSSLDPEPSISLFVKSILVFEEDATQQKTRLPFFADGYPGLMFQQTERGLVVSPHSKKMPSLFLYGQTIQPIELIMEGPYQIIVFQLYPFVLRSFFHVQAKDINDDCYNLQSTENGAVLVQQLNTSSSLEQRIKLLSTHLFTIFQSKKDSLDFEIRKAIQLIIDAKGQTPIHTLCSKIHLTERTFERRFVKEVGLTAKQFCTMIQFQHSLQQLNRRDFQKLSDIVYSNGYADQSHFIKVFKAFTHKTPKAFKD